ncbi:hypothetical protein [Brevundimonas sp.]|uniref:hypothetical protein n=1 Tax=Brevundimonas sp. TaxID=1871086 RepID=UPI0025F481ED|nr:hypothetical protein [Brevundimonas sp.]
MSRADGSESAEALADPDAIGVLHHLSSSGGTLIARTVAAMPSAVLLSEVHPLSPRRVWFNPFDPIPQLLANYPDLGPDADGQKAEFRRRLELVWNGCRRVGRRLVLRNHAHSDFLGTDPTGRLELETALPDGASLKRAATLRDPVDAWLSMQASGFAKSMKSFDDYCVRVEAFLAQFEPDEVETYEAFVAEPAAVARRLCERLGVVFVPGRETAFAEISISGNSGRGEAWTEVRRAQRRPFTPAFRRRVLKSEAYGRIAARFGYPRDPIDAF